MKKKIVAIVAIVALIAILGICLVACNQEDYAKRLEKAGYHVTTSEKYEGKDVEWAVFATKGAGGLFGNGETVTVVKFANADDAKDCEEDVKELFTTKRSGNIVIFGTEQGVKDAQ